MAVFSLKKMFRSVSAMLASIIILSMPAGTHGENGTSKLTKQQTIDNPYDKLNWKSVDYLHSMSHQHGKSSRLFWEMGFRHMAFSNYYPSKPKDFPLPEKFLRKHPEALSSPNAEHHSLTDNGLHFNAIGSFYTTGGKHLAKKYVKTVSPVIYEFKGLNRYNPDKRPWESVYWLKVDIRNKNQDEEIEPSKKPLLTIEGAVEINRKTLKPITGKTIHNRPLPNKRSNVYIRAMSDCLKVTINFDDKTSKVMSLGFWQGIHRPWRDAFRAALDGNKLNSEEKPIEGMLYADGGGITINHPMAPTVSHYLTMLDFDKRVLGIEVWNSHFNFGSPKKPLLFYQHWDAILSTGRRCLGFFVRDHMTYRRGRNVLIVPDKPKDQRKSREHDALRAYRKGCFFGLLGAITVNKAGKLCPPYDYSQFRFSRIAVRRDAAGKPLGVDVEVRGEDKTKRPNLQIRFITDKGIAYVVNNQHNAFFEFPRKSTGIINCKYVRVEAFAYPMQSNGTQLTAKAISSMNVHEISQLYDLKANQTDYSNRYIPKSFVVDMIFSQPIRILTEPSKK